MRIVYEFADGLLQIHQYSSQRHSCTKSCEHDFLLLSVSKYFIAMLAHRYWNGGTAAVSILWHNVTRHSFLCYTHALGQLLQREAAGLMAYEIVNIFYIIARSFQTHLHHESS